jgi:serine/threonine protein kinase
MLPQGTQLGSYEILDPIASGGMGVVYRGRHVTFGEEVAIKVLLPNLAMNPKVRHRFQSEAFVQRQMHHPNIVGVVDFLDQDGHLAIVMELVDGPTLENLLEERPGPWSQADTAGVLGPIVSAMSYAHAREAVHRDLKPANVLMKPNGQGGFTPKVTDFGLVKVLSDSQGMTRAGAVMGTVPYMAPEQFAGLLEIDARADVFALGMLGYRLIKGDFPVNPTNMMVVADFYAGRTKIPPLSGVLKGPILSALDMNREGRPVDAAAFLAQIGQESARSLWVPGFSTLPEGPGFGAVGEEPEEGTDPEIVGVMEATDPEIERSSVVEGTDPGIELALEEDDTQRVPKEGLVSSGDAIEVTDPEIELPEPDASESSVSEEHLSPDASETPERDVAEEWAAEKSKGSMGAVMILAVVLGIGAMGFLNFGGESAEDKEANALAEEVLGKLKQHKTQFESNRGERGAEVLRNATFLANDAVAVSSTDQALAVQALAAVWQHKWHYSGEWPGDDVYQADNSMTRRAVESGLPAAHVARATLLMFACTRSNGGSMQDDLCASAESSLASAWAIRHEESGVDPRLDWLWFELQWQELRYRLNHVRNLFLARSSPTTIDNLLRKAVQFCDQPREPMSASPVNDYEFMKDCVRARGWSGDHVGFLKESQQLVAHLQQDAPSATGRLDPTNAAHGKLNTWLATAGDLACSPVKWMDVPSTHGEVNAHRKRSAATSEGVSAMDAHMCAGTSLAAVGCYHQGNDLWWSGASTTGSRISSGFVSSLSGALENLSSNPTCYIDGKYQRPSQPWKGWEAARGRKSPSYLGAEFIRVDKGGSVSRPFVLGKTEVTRAQWRLVMGNDPSGYFSGCSTHCPVQNVNWYDAVNFANRLSDKEGLERCYSVNGTSVSTINGSGCKGYRLPTVNEWRRAAKAGQTYTYAGSNSHWGVSWSSDNSSNRPHAVATKKANAWGFHDMSGNVFEWTGTSEGSSQKVLGGSWSFSGSSATLSKDWADPRSSRHNAIGLRIARTVE